MRLYRLHDCQACGSCEERVFTDSYTGLEVCPDCLYKIVGELTLSPASEGDNLKKLLRSALGSLDIDEEVEA
jgi:hypothetical protein